MINSAFSCLAKSEMGHSWEWMKSRPDIYIKRSWLHLCWRSAFKLFLHLCHHSFACNLETFQICSTWLSWVTMHIRVNEACYECSYMHWMLFSPPTPSSLLTHGCVFDGDTHLIGTIFVKVCFISAVIWLNYLCLISKWCAFLTWLDKSPWTIEFCMSFVCKSACVLMIFFYFLSEGNRLDGSKAVNDII